MMESCLAGKPERVGPVEVEDIRKDLLGEFAALPAQDSAQSENLQVFLRVRPFTAAESDSEGSQECVTIEGPDTVVLKAPRSSQSNRQNEKSLPQTAQRFSFTQVFGPDSSQRKVFEGSVRGLVRDVLDGGNCLVFTYGVTNAGKTFTFLGPDHDSGLLPRSLSVIFNSIEDRLYSRNDLKPQRCRDFSRLTPDQQAAESSSKKNLLRLYKESDKTLTSGRSTFLDGSSLSTDSSVNSVTDSDSFSLDVSTNVRFSVWVSFCEIYNDNIHDLLEQVPIGHQKRTVLRLSQDVKGNSFIKDLRWVQVNSSEEAYKVMKIGKKNQSFSATRLNQLSSRSHSIFSIRILKVDDVGVTRVLGISELALCDLAGSERCSRTHNTGERLKEAGNINSSLLTLGKCISAMRLNQHAKFQHHVPFRESKLTHFLQFFFCGAGRVTMVVNINQNSTCFDETLNVLKFSALAQKVVVLNTRPVVVDDAPQRSAMELSMIIDEADQRRKVFGRGRKSSLVAWETTLEDLLEDEDGEDSDEEEEEEEESVMEGTVLEAGGEETEEGEEDRTMEEEGKPDREAALRLVLEAQIREEVSTEFMELFNKMEKDYSERLEKEREILEERAEKRVEILKNLVNKTVDLSTINTENTKQEQTALLEGFISSMTEDLERIKADAQTAQICLTAEQTHSAELEALQLEKQQTQEQLQEAMGSLEQQKQKLSDLMVICQQKDEMINKLQSAIDDTAETATKDRALVESIKLELLELQRTCSCRRGEGDMEETRKRQRDSVEDTEERGPAKKRVVLEEEIWRLQEENDKKEETISELREREERRRGLEDELRRREEEVEELKKEQILLEQKMLQLTDLDECPNCASVFASLDSEQRESSRLTKENKALVNGIFQLQTEVTGLQSQLKQQTDTSNSLSEQLNTTKTHLRELESQSEERTSSISSLTQEVEHLKEKIKEEERRSNNNNSAFHTAVEELKKESQAALERSAEKSEQIKNLQREKEELEENLKNSEQMCAQLREDLSSQRSELSLQLQSLRAELESEGAALRRRLEEMERSEEEKTRNQEREREELHQAASEREKLLEETCRQMEVLRKELERLREELQRKEEDEEEDEGKENRAAEKKVTVVDELKEELQRFEEMRGRQQAEEGRSRKSREFEAVRREMEKLQKRKEEKDRELQANTQKCVGRVLTDKDALGSPLSSNMADRKKTPKTTGRKRKSCEVQGLVFSENKRNRLRNIRKDDQSSSVVKEKKDGALQKIGELIHSSPSILGSKAKTILSLVSGPEVPNTATKPKRGRRKLFKKDAGSPLFDSPHMMQGGGEDEKESDHVIIKRQLRSKTCKK